MKPGEKGDLSRTHKEVKESVDCAQIMRMFAAEVRP